MKRTRRTTFTNRLLSIVICIAMLLSYLPVSALAASAAELVTMESDPSTVDTYESMLGTDADGNRYAGRIWTDKSVFEGTGSENLDGIADIAYGADEFLVVYSTLGSTTSVTSETIVSGDMDVVIVLDNSASMGSYTSGSITRLESVTAAANELISGILENSDNRLSVITYSTDATTILPLNYYEKTDNCLTVSIRNKPSSDSGGNAPVSSGDGTTTATATILGTNTTAGTTNDGYQMGTNLQSGINAAMATLYNAADTENRIPVVIVLTDGVADMAVQSGMIGNTAGSTYAHPQSNAIGSGVALSTLLNAAYWKYMVGQKYNADTIVYTVGVDIGSTSDANVVMDPVNYFTSTNTNSIASTAYSWYLNWTTASNAVTGTESVSGGNNGRPGGNNSKSYTWTFAQPDDATKQGIMENIAYSDEYFNVTSSQLSDAFDDILTRISTTQDAFQAITDSIVTEGDTPQTYVDFIGDYMEIKEFKGVTLYGKLYAVTEGASSTVVNADGTVTVTTEYIVGSGSDAITDPLTGEAFNIGDVIDIELIHTYQVDADGNRTSAGEQDLWIRILEEAMPLIYHKVVTENGESTYTVYEEDPLRVYYTVGISSYIAPAGTILLHRVDEEYLEANTVNGVTYFYTNQYFEMNTQASGFGDTHTSATPNEANRYYFHQYNNSIFASVTDADGNEVVWDAAEYGVLDDGSYITTVMTYSDYLSLSDDAMVYTTVSYDVPVGTGTATEDGGIAYDSQHVTYIVYTTWGDLKDAVTFYDSVNGVYLNSDGTTSETGVDEEITDTSFVTSYINSTANISVSDIEIALSIDSWRISRLHNMTVDKTENITDTAAIRVAPTHDTTSVHEGSMVAWLGNNGRLGVIDNPPKTVHDTEGNDIDGNTVMIGDVLTYQIDATNYETSAATITITDTVPEGAQYVDGSATQGGVYDADTGIITWTIENVAVGETVTVSFQVTVVDAAPDSISNTAYIQVGNSPAYETNTTNNPPMGKTASATGVTPSGDVQVGSVITYNIYYLNDSDQAATVIISDSIPTGTTYVSGSASYSGTDVLVEAADANGTVTGLTWSLTGVPAGASGSVTFRVHVNASAVSPVENTATIQVGENAPSVLTNTTENDLAYGDLVLTKTVATGNASGSSEKYFTLVLYSGVEGVSTLNGTFTVTGSSKVSSVTFENGTAYLDIKHGESITIIDLPAGTTVTVYEQTAGGYTPTYSVSSQKIVANASVRIDVTNTYNVTSTSITLEGSKILTGQALEDGEFSFLVYEGTVLVSTGENDVNGNIIFKPITYTAAGTHTYTIVEVNSGEKGIQYDTTEYTVTVTVTDNGEGQLVASVAYPNGGLVFANTYTPESTSVTLEGTKTLTGQALEDGEFSFLVYEGTTVVSTGENDANGSIIFKPITYTAAGTHTYTIVEVDSGLKGITYDPAEFTVTVTVTDDGNGQLVASVAYPDGDIAFHNTYVPESTSVTLEGTKSLTGKVLEDGAFSFLVYEGTTVVSTGENEADGSITFKPITYTAVGTHTYTIVEVNSGLGGVDYDQTVFTVTVTVTDDGNGQLTATVTYPASGVVFRNSYTPDPVSVTLEGAKNLTGRNMVDGEFSFIVTENGTVVSTGTNKADGTVEFKPITYTAVGTHTYIISEVGSDAGGVDYDDTTYTVTVTVTDNGEGQLVASVAYPAGGVVFNNVYTTDSTSVTLEGTKVLTGRTMADNEFSFIVTDALGNVVSTGLSKKDGTIAFTPISYAAAGTYTYTVSEVAGNLGGVTYTDVTYTVTVTVTDNGEGQLVASVAYPTGGLVFTNTYTPNATSLTLEGTKVLTGRTMADNEFSFLVTDENGKVVSTGLSKKDGTIVFTPIGYTAVGTYTYTVTEVAGNLGGVTYSVQTHTVTVNVTDNGEGQLVAAATYPTGGVVFNNTYTPDAASVTLEGTKVLTGRAMEDNEFSFIVTDAQGNVVSTGLSKKDGTIVFTPIGYTAVGTYTYTVTEVAGNLGGVTYSDQAYTVTVTVTDNGEGQLVAAVTYPDGAMVFNNTYHASSTSYTPVAEKNLTGRVMEDNEFSFVITDEAGNVVSTGLSKKDGTIVFTPIGYTAAGTYKYTVTEVAGNLSGISYDPASYTFTVVVVDDGAGSLVATATYPQAITFNNVYTTAPVDVTLTATKILNGKVLADNEFRFVLKDEDGNVLQTVSNKKDGSITFSGLAFSTPGTYIYTISEETGTDSRYSYSNAVYTVVIEVRDDLQGNLYAATHLYLHYGTADQADVGAVSFYNSYTAPSISLDLNDKIDISKSVNDTANTNYSPAGFKFEVYDMSGAVVASGTSDENGYIDLEGDLVFQVAGDYRFMIVEVADNAAAVTYDPTVWIVHVVVVYDNTTGMLSVSEVFFHILSNNGDHSNTASSIEFVNTYDPEDAPLAITVNKALTGRVLAAGEFHFQLLDSQGNVVAEAVNDASGNVTFHLTYAQTGTYTYTVKELNNALGGISYDTQSYPIEVTVTDLGGELKATVTSGDVTFNNSYAANPVTVELGAAKVLSGRALIAGEFTFQLVDSEGDSITATNAADGTVSFGQIEYTQPGTYVYTVSELNGDLGGVTYSSMVYTATVNVWDDGVGQLHAAVTYTYPSSSGELQNIALPLFYNVYETTSVSVDLQATKELTGRELNDGEFTFVLTDSEGNTITATNKANSVISFESLTFTAPGTYTYTLSEENNNKGGVSYDSATYEVVIVVTDNLEGALEAIVTVNSVPIAANKNGAYELATFENSYSAAPVDVDLAATKELTGRDLVSGEFTFKLTDSEGNTITATNTAEGVISFEGIEYTAAGTYVYTLSEVSGNLGGVTYDASEYTITVYVADDLEGNLVATLVMDNARIIADENGVYHLATFENSYEAASVSVSLEAEKTLTGRDLVSGEFTFQLTDAQENAITAANDAKGSITFAMTFEEAGTYSFTMSEVNGTAANVTYDTARHSIAITVADDGNGKLFIASVTVNGSEVTAGTAVDTGVVFTNTYTQPDNPKTSDKAPIELLAMLMLASVTSLTVLLLVRKKEWLN